MWSTKADQSPPVGESHIKQYHRLPIQAVASNTVSHAHTHFISGFRVRSRFTRTWYTLHVKSESETPYAATVALAVSLHGPVAPLVLTQRER